MGGRKEDSIILVSSEDEEVTKAALEADELRRQQLARRKRKLNDREVKRQLSIFEAFSKQKFEQPPLQIVNAKSNTLNTARGSLCTMSESPKSSPNLSFSDGENDQSVSHFSLYIRENQ